MIREIPLKKDSRYNTTTIANLSSIKHGMNLPDGYLSVFIEIEISFEGKIRSITCHPVKPLQGRFETDFYFNCHNTLKTLKIRLYNSDFYRVHSRYGNMFVSMYLEDQFSSKFDLSVVKRRIYHYDKNQYCDWEN